MPRISDRITIKNESLDRRVKLTHEQKDEIRKRWLIHVYRVQNNLLGESLSQRKLAKEYGVSRRTIVFILHPERRIENVKRRQERGGWKQYYNKDEWREVMREHRNYKKGLFQKGLIK